jgi:hypothetical protein
MITPLRSSFHFTFLLSFALTGLHAQSPAKVRVRSGKDLAFFQQGRICDTVSSGRHDMFYLQVPRDLRCNLRIDVENGQLWKTSDTLYRLVHVGSMNYTHHFADSVGYGGSIDKNISRCRNYQVMINGANSSRPALITIRFYDSAKDSLLLTNRYYYK